MTGRHEGASRWRSVALGAIAGLFLALAVFLVGAAFYLIWHLLHGGAS